MDDFEIGFDIQYAPEISPKETQPRMDIYVDGNVVNDPVTIQLTENNTTGILTRIPVTLKGKYNSRKPLPAYTKIMFRTTCLRENDSGTPCRIDAGLGFINLIDLQQIPGVFQQDVPLMLYTCGGFEKGKLRVSCTPDRINMGPRLKWANSSKLISAGTQGQSAMADGSKMGTTNDGTPPSSFVTGDSPESLMEKLQREKLSNGMIVSSTGLLTTDPTSSTGTPLAVEMEMLEHIQKTQAIEMSFPNTDPETGNVRVPICYSNEGMLRRVPVVAEGYMLFFTPRSNLFFWVNMVDICLKREKKNVNDFPSLDLTQRSRLMVEICCALVQSLDYIGDIFDMNKRFTQRVEGFLKGSPDVAYDPRRVDGCERFGDALRDKTGDCEDLALAILMIFTALLDADKAGMFNSTEHAYLRELARIAQQYVAFLTLDSVTAMAVKADEDRNRTASGKVLRKLGAHMAVKFLPAIYVRDCILRYVNETGDTAALERMPFFPFSEDAADLQIMVGEGTGMFECWGIIYDPIAVERTTVYRTMASFAFAKKPILHPPRVESTFYVGSMIGLCNYWFRLGYNVGGVWFGYVGKYADLDVGAPNVFQRGVKFVEMQARSDRMCIRPRLEFSPAVMAYMRVWALLRVRPRDLILTPQGVAGQPKKEPTLDALSAELAAKHRPQLVVQDPAPMYVGTHQLIPRIVSGIRQDFEKHTFITKMDYECEHMTDWSHCYRIGIYANAK